MKRHKVIDRNQLQRREKKRILALSFLGLAIIFIALLAFMLAFFKRGWHDNADKNILLLPETVDGYTGKLLFAHISPSNREIEVVMINPELPVNVIGGYEEYPLRSIYPLWKLEKRDQTILPAIYSFALSKVVDQVWKSDKYHFDANEPDFKKITQNLLQFKITSPLTLADRIWLYKFAHSLRPDEITVKTVETMDDWKKVSADIEFADQSAVCNFAVVNSIGVSGAGGTVGKMLESSGFSIVRITDENPALEKTTLILGENATKCQDQQDHTLNAMPLKIKIENDSAKANQYRANMVLILGEDMKSYFGVKEE